MRPMPQQVRGAAPASKEERQRSKVALGGVTLRARQHEVVAPVVRRLSSARGHVIERHRRWLEALITVGTHGAVLVEQPGASSSHRAAMRGARGELCRGGMRTICRWTPNRANVGGRAFCFGRALRLRLRASPRVVLVARFSRRAAPRSSCGPGGGALVRCYVRRSVAVRGIVGRERQTLIWGEM